MLTITQIPGGALQRTVVEPRAIAYGQLRINTRMIGISHARIPLQFPAQRSHCRAAAMDSAASRSRHHIGPCQPSSTAVSRERERGAILVRTHRLAILVGAVVKLP